MKWYHYFVCFLAGMFIANMVPHLAAYSEVIPIKRIGTRRFVPMRPRLQSVTFTGVLPYLRENPHHTEAAMRLSYFYSILLICAFISTALAQSSREIHKIVPLNSNGRLVIDTYKGSITITTHEKPEVEVDVKIESDDSDSDDAARDVKDTEIEINGEGNEVTLKTNYDNIEHEHYKHFWDFFTDHSGSSYSRPLVHYTIKMPRKAELNIKDYKSQARIDNLQSDLKYNTYKGEVEINNLNGSIDLETYKGRVRVLFSEIKNGSRFETYKGDITITVPKDNDFELRTDFERRVEFSTDFNVETIKRGNKHHPYNDYRGKINGGGPTLELKSDKGDLCLRAK
jgi:hypothetical protein